MINADRIYTEKSTMFITVNSLLEYLFLLQNINVSVRGINKAPQLWYRNKDAVNKITDNMIFFIEKSSVRIQDESTTKSIAKEENGRMNEKVNNSTAKRLYIIKSAATVNNAIL